MLKIWYDELYGYCVCDTVCDTVCCVCDTVCCVCVCDCVLLCWEVYVAITMRQFVVGSHNSQVE